MASKAPSCEIYKTEVEVDPVGHGAATVLTRSVEELKQTVLGRFEIWATRLDVRLARLEAAIANSGYAQAQASESPTAPLFHEGEEMFSPIRRPLSQSLHRKHNSFRSQEMFSPIRRPLSQSLHHKHNSFRSQDSDGLAPRGSEGLEWDQKDEGLTEALTMTLAEVGYQVRDNLDMQFHSCFNAEGAKLVMQRNVSSSSWKHDNGTKDFIEFVEQKKSGSTPVRQKPAWYIINPASGKRLVWDLCGLSLILYDLMAIPLQLAFEPPHNLMFEVMFWLALAFWQTDMIVSFFSAFYVHGAEENRMSRIFIHYARTWLPFDVFIILSDWVSWLADESRAPALARMGKTLRVLRIVRSLRLLRLVKMRKMFDAIMDHIDSEYAIIVLGMSKGTLFVIGMNHIIACSWWALGAADLWWDDHWILHCNFHADPSMGYKYLTSLHWSLTQFTPASMEVGPRNLAERLFAVLVLIFALLVFSSFLSSITASMTQLRQLSWKYDKNLSLLRKYLRTHMISTPLCMRILKYVEYKLSKANSIIRESDVSLLATLSSQLHMELVQETYEPILSRHPFMAKYGEMSTSGMREACNRAAQRAYYAVGDLVFAAGARATHMLFVMKGKLKYKRRGLEGGADSLRAEDMSVGDWCSEGAVWLRLWEHQGSMRVEENADALVVDATAFIEVTRGHRRVYDAAIEYGANFAEWVAVSAAAGTLTDLCPPEHRQTLETFAQKVFTGDFGRLAACESRISSSGNAVVQRTGSTESFHSSSRGTSPRGDVPGPDTGGAELGAAKGEEEGFGRIEARSVGHRFCL